MPRHLISPLALLLTLAAAGCGSSTPVGEAASAAPAGRATPSTAAAAKGRPIEITANDTMKFSVVEIHAKAGERLSVTLVNQGTTPKFSMGHNWILLGGDGRRRRVPDRRGAKSPTTDYVPAGNRAAILAVDQAPRPRRADTVTFTAPASAGRYPFLCSFPGHAQVGMRGVLIVD